MILFLILGTLMLVVMILFLTEVYLPSEYKRIESEKAKHFYKISLWTFCLALAVGFYCLALGEALPEGIKTVFQILGIILLIGSVLWAIGAYIYEGKLVKAYYQTTIDQNEDTKENTDDNN